MSKKSYRLLASLLLMLVATLTSCEKFSIDETTGKSHEANANVARKALLGMKIQEVMKLFVFFSDQMSSKKRMKTQSK